MITITRIEKKLENGTYNLHKTILDELGDISGKKVLHLQCNTGADSICLAKLGAKVTGVDLVPENIAAAKKLAKDLGIDTVDFFECDIMDLKEKTLYTIRHCIYFGRCFNMDSQ